jgi:hypothetical protein
MMFLCISIYSCRHSTESVNSNDQVDTTGNREYLKEKAQMELKIHKMDSLIKTSDRNGKLYYERAELNFLTIKLDSAIVDYKRSAALGYKARTSYELISDIFSIKGEKDSASYYISLSKR